MSFHLDAAGIEADEGMRDGPCEHAADASRENVTSFTPKRAESVTSLSVTNSAYSIARSLRHDALAASAPEVRRVVAGLPIASRADGRKTAPMEPWRKLAEETVYSRYRRVVSKRFEQPGGQVVEYEVKDEDDMVAVLALTDQHEVVLVRQFRPGPEAVLLELPAGVVDAGADPADAAAAELLEETGYVGRLEPAGTILEEGYSNRTKYVFVGHACRAEGGPENPQLTEAVVITIGDFRSHLRSGRMADVDAGYLALDHLGLL